MTILRIIWLRSLQVRIEATAKMRSYLTDVPPSSPSMALLKGKELVHFIPREQIEGQEPETIIRNLALAYNEHCQKA